MNFSYIEAQIEGLEVHKVGNQSEDEYLFISEQAPEINDSLKELLRNYFLSSFKTEEMYRFHHDIDIAMNEVYTCVNSIFDDPAKLHEQSIHLAKHLYNQSVHPKIRGGEFYVVYFSNCLVDGAYVDGVGLFKSENKETFLEVEQQPSGIELSDRLGMSLQKLDKGCIIFNQQKEEGFLVAIIDPVNKNNEAQYWKDDFLSVMVVNNEFHQTNQFLGIAKQYVTKQMGQDFEVSKTDQIDLLNRSIDYFKTHESFDKEEFEEEVLFHKNLIDSFRKFDDTYRQDHAIDLEEKFEISNQAVKKQARVFKSVLKLDKNFHIYIHGNRELIEQGVDENGRKFYKIYYENEA